MSNIVW